MVGHKGKVCSDSYRHRLYQIKGKRSPFVKAIETEPRVTSLNSYNTFILLSNNQEGKYDRHFIWYGQCTNEEEKLFAKEIIVKLNGWHGAGSQARAGANKPVEEIFEGKESGKFSHFHSYGHQ